MFYERDNLKQRNQKRISSLKKFSHVINPLICVGFVIVFWAVGMQHYYQKLQLDGLKLGIGNSKPSQTTNIYNKLCLNCSLLASLRWAYSSAPSSVNKTTLFDKEISDSISHPLKQLYLS